MATFWTRWWRQRRRVTTDEIDRLEQYGAWLAIHPHVYPPTRAELEVTAWAERNAYWSGNIGQIEGRAMTARERLEWEVARKREECEAAITHEIEVMVGLGCSPDLAKATVWSGDGNDKGAAAKLGKEFHALERELAALEVEPGQVPEAHAEPDELASTRALLGIQDGENVVAPAPVPDLEEATKATELGGWPAFIAPAMARMAAKAAAINIAAAEKLADVVLAPEDEAAARRREAVAAMEGRDRAAAEAYQKNRAGLAEFRQQAAVEPTPSQADEAQPTGEEAVVDSPALPSYYSAEVVRARTLVPSMVPELDLTSTEAVAAEQLMWDEPKAQEAAPEVVVPAPEPEQGAEAPTWEANQQHAMAKLSGVQEVADREGWESKPDLETPNVAKEASSEVPDVMADTLSQWQRARDMQEIERRRRAREAEEEQEDEGTTRQAGQEPQL